MNYSQADLQDARARVGRAQRDVDTQAHELVRLWHSSMSAQAADHALTAAATIRDEMMARVRAIEARMKQQNLEV